jgi:hypothetical protein
MSQDLTTARRMIIGAAGTAVAVLLAGCGLINAPGGGTDADAATISITEPTGDATVSQPFTLKVETSVEIGPPESGRHHFHLTFDGKTDDYTVEPDGEVTIDQLSPGRHTITVTLQNADHSPAGAEGEISVMVSNGAGSASPADPGSGSDGY